MNKVILMLIVSVIIILFNQCGEKRKEIVITDEEIEQTYQWLEKNQKYQEKYKFHFFYFKFDFKGNKKMMINEKRKILDSIVILRIGIQIPMHERPPIVPKIEDKELIHLKPFQNLKILNMGDLKTIKGSGLAHLKYLRKLEGLSLQETSVDDASLKHLIDLPSLKALDISSPNITSAGIDKLKRARPDLKIEYEILDK